MGEEKSKKNLFKLGKKSIIVIIAILIVIISLFLIIRNIGNKTSKQSNAGNISNMGLAVEYNGTVFYNKYEKGIFKVKNGKETRITDETAYSINIVNDVIYYLTVSNFGTIDIKSVEVNGNNLKHIATIYTTISKIYVVDGYIYYYSNEDNVNGIAKVDIDGNDKTVLTSAIVRDFQVMDNEIYFTDNIDNLYKMTLTGTDLERIISDFSIKNFQIAGKWIYYLDEAEKALYKVKKDGSSKSIVSDLVKENMYNVTDKKIYFFDSETRALSKINLDGKKYEEVTKLKSNTTKISVVNDIVYYLDVSADNSQVYQMFRVKTNGNNAKSIEY